MAWSGGLQDEEKNKLSFVNFSLTLLQHRKIYLFERQTEMDFKALFVREPATLAKNIK